MSERIPELQAKPVEASYQLTSTSPTYNTKGEVKAYQNKGTVHIEWHMSPRYAIREARYPETAPSDMRGRIDKDKTGFAITLLGNGAPVASERTTERDGVWDTKQVWGSGWSAQIAVWNEYPVKDKGWIVLALTEETKDS